MAFFQKKTVFSIVMVSLAASIAFAGSEETLIWKPGNPENPPKSAYFIDNPPDLSTFEAYDSVNDSKDDKAGINTNKEITGNADSEKNETNSALKDSKKEPKSRKLKKRNPEKKMQTKR